MLEDMPGKQYEYSIAEYVGHRICRMKVKIDGSAHLQEKSPDSIICQSTSL